MEAVAHAGECGSALLAGSKWHFVARPAAGSVRTRGVTPMHVRTTLAAYEGLLAVAGLVLMLVIACALVPGLGS